MHCDALCLNKTLDALEIRRSASKLQLKALRWDNAYMPWLAICYIKKIDSCVEWSQEELQFRLWLKQNSPLRFYISLETVAFLLTTIPLAILKNVQVWEASTNLLRQAYTKGSKIYIQQSRQYPEDNFPHTHITVFPWKWKTIAIQKFLNFLS